MKEQKDNEIKADLNIEKAKKTYERPVLRRIPTDTSFSEILMSQPQDPEVFPTSESNMF